MSTTMDRAPNELQFLSIPDILRESISIPRYSPKTFYLLTLTLIFPLSFAVLAHSLFTHPIVTQMNNTFADPAQARYQWTLLLLFQFCYLIFLFAFSLLSTVAVVCTVVVVFTVASLYTSKPVSFSSTASAIPLKSIKNLDAVSFSCEMSFSPFNKITLKKQNELGFSICSRLSSAPLVTAETEAIRSKYVTSPLVSKNE